MQLGEDYSKFSGFPMASFSDRRLLGNVLGRFERMVSRLRTHWREWAGPGRYRPEKHYMRGPGPKCSANSHLPNKDRDRGPSAP